MASSVVLWTGDKLGSFTVNIDWREIFRPTVDFFWKFISNDGNRRKVLILIAVILFFKRLRYRINHDNRESEQREKARIWEEEKIKAKKKANEELK